MNLHRIDPDDQRALQALTVPLAEGVALAECVAPDGSTAFWLLQAGSHTYGCACRRCVPHELTGRLPVELRDRLGLVHRCGAPTRSTGQPCRSIVQDPDATCTSHLRQTRP